MSSISRWQVWRGDNPCSEVQRTTFASNKRQSNRSNKWRHLALGLEGGLVDGVQVAAREAVGARRHAALQVPAVAC